MKKTILTVFGIIIVLVIALIAVNVATAGALWHSVIEAVASPINKAWSAVAGEGEVLINTDDITPLVADENDLGSLVDE